MNIKTDNTIFKKALIIFLCIVMIFGLTGCESKGVNQKELQSKLDAYILEKDKDGTLDALKEYWTYHSDEGKKLDYSLLTGENGTIRCGTKTICPFSYVIDNEWTGITIELLYNFCLEYGYDIDIVSYTDTNSQIVAVAGGKIDIAASNISITEERKKSVDFSPGYFTSRVILTVKNENVSSYNSLEDFHYKKLATLSGGSVPGIIRAKWNDADVSEYNTVADMCIALSQDKIDAVVFDEMIITIAINEFPNLSTTDFVIYDDDCFGIVYPKTDTSSGSLTESFRRTVIEDNRWQYFLKGIENTLLITLSSIIFGCILGFVMYIFCRNNGKITGMIMKVCLWFIDGLPVVVLLMILYYLVFDFLNLNNTVVSIITFTLIFASSVFSMLKNAVSAIDIGQYEVSYALGYSEKQTFFKMIFPQALNLIWIPLRGSVKAQIKATSIVGYIATQDITKAGDMVRSSTYEAFFPLLITALIYFILGALLSRSVDVIKKLVSPSAKKSAKYLSDIVRRDEND